MKSDKFQKKVGKHQDQANNEKTSKSKINVRTIIPHARLHVLLYKFSLVLMGGQAEGQACADQEAAHMSGGKKIETFSGNFFDILGNSIQLSQLNSTSTEVGA